MDGTASTDNVEIRERGVALAAVRAVLERARRGAGHSLFIVGEAGLGKTTILEHAGNLARADRLGRSRGDPLETTLPFGLVAQVIDGLGGRELLKQALGERWVEEIRTRQFYRLLGWLEDLAREPLLIAIDDLHWADADSMTLLSFICRRIASLPIAIIGTLRPWPAPALDAVLSLSESGHASVERLSPLTEAATATLLAARLASPPSGELVHRVWQLCGGNPLLLEQAVMTLSREGVIGRTPQSALPLPSDWLLLSRFANLPTGAMRYAQAASVLGIRFRPDIAAQVARLGDARVEAALKALGRSGLVRDAEDGEVEFVHPLFQQALYDDLGEPLRRRLHALAFAALAHLGLDSEASEHAIRAHLVGNAEAIQLLQRAGRAALTAGAVATARTCLAAAVRYAVGNPPPGLVIALAEATFADGDLTEALHLYEGILARPRLPMALRVEALRMSGRALQRTGAHARATDRLQLAANLAATQDPASAIRAIASVGYAVLAQKGPVEATVRIAGARKLAESVDETVRPLLREVVAAMSSYFALLTGDAGDWEEYARALNATVTESGSEDDLDLTLRVWSCRSSASYLLERFTEAAEAYEVASAIAGRAGAIENGGHALHLAQARTLTRLGRLTEALSQAELACEEAKRVPALEASARLVRAEVLLLLGRGAECDRDWERGEAAAAACGEQLATLGLWHVRARRYVQEGALAEAHALFNQIEGLNGCLGIGEPCLFTWARDAIALRVATGHLTSAERLVGWLDRCAVHLPCRWPRIAAAVGQAGLAERTGDIPAAEASFQAALMLHEDVELPLERSQTLIDYGSFLRRTGRPVMSRPYLAEALALSEQAGAVSLAARAGSEMAVAGGRRRSHRERERLTPQEVRVERLAAAGRTNREIASELYLSIKTVESHLQQVYAKRGIHSRRQLMSVAGRGKPEDPSTSH